MMQGQVQALVARVKSLEDQAQLASGSPDDAKQSKSLENRLESIEQEQAKLEHEESGQHEMKGKPGRQQGVTVVAPFTVVDGNNKIVMKVLGVLENGHDRGIHATNSAGEFVSYMGSATNGGVFFAKKPNSKPQLVMGIGPDGPKLQIFDESGKQQQFLLKPQSIAFYAANGGEKGADLIMGLGTKGPGIQMNEAGQLKFSVQRDSLGFYGDGGSVRSRLQKESIGFYGDDGKSVLSLFGAKNREKGFLQLSDSNGDAMVEAGVLDSHKGYVLASPYQASVDPHGDPSVLRGGKKK